MVKASVTIALLVVATLLGTRPLLAQPADGEIRETSTAETAPNSKATASQTAEAKAKPKEQAKTGSKDKEEGKEEDKSFIPSEEISEDFAVSFPVDI